MIGALDIARATRISATIAIVVSICTPTFGQPSEPTAAKTIDELPIDATDREHWAFQPLRSAAPPVVRDRNWPTNPIDDFVLARLESVQLTPAHAAGRATLIRRVSFDLTGLPPTPKQVADFVRDRRPDAYLRLVDELLGGPRYGEHWAQHWLDLARFAETDGFEHDKVRREAWRYRDWVLAALNEDLPYDRFIQMQIAGDLISPSDPQATASTGFCLAGPDMPDINSQQERRHNLLNETTSTVGAVILGLQVGCAQCHDHKYDPISQADFYRLRSFFEPAVAVRKNESVSFLKTKSGEPPTSRLMIRGDWRRPGPALTPAYPRIANASNAEAPTGAKSRRLALASWLTRPDHPLTTRVIVNRIWQYHFGQALARSPSDFGVMGQEPSHPELLDYLAVEFTRGGWSLKKLHRLIVTSSTYQQASRPNTQQADWAKSWAERVEQDPENELLTRFPRQRLSGEMIRDAMLFVSGTLDTRMGGPGVRPPLPKELVSTLLRNQWNVSPNPADHHRRSLFLFARRNLRYPVFEAFDRPDANASCPQRGQSITAPQSLMLLNSELSIGLAQRLAGRVLKTHSDPDKRIDDLYKLVFSRPPSTNERKQLTEFLDKQQRVLIAEKRPANDLRNPIPKVAGVDRVLAAAYIDLCLALFNSSEFIYRD